MTEQAPPLTPDDEAGELLAGTPPPPHVPQPAPTPEEVIDSGISKGAPPPPTAEPDVEQEIEVYTAAEVQAASEEMQKLPPQTFIAMKKRIEALEKHAEIGEAGGIAWTTLYSKSGAEFSITQRDVSSSETALDGLVRTIKYAAAKYKLSPMQGSGGGEAQVTNVDAGIETGTGLLNWISVDRNENDPSKLVVKFSVGKFKYPFQEHRGAKQALSLFDSAICEPQRQGGWTEAHFATPGQRYEINGELKVKWEHRGKYYNVLLVHA